MKTNSTSTRIRHGILRGSLPLAGAGSAQAVAIYDNGPFLTHPGQGFGGADASAVAVGLTTFGFGMNATAPVRLAGNFTIAAGHTWNLTGVRFYGYQTGSTTTWSCADSSGSSPGKLACSPFVLCTRLARKPAGFFLFTQVTSPAAVNFPCGSG